MIFFPRIFMADHSMVDRTTRSKGLFASDSAKNLVSTFNWTLFHESRFLMWQVYGGAMIDGGIIGD